MFGENRKKISLAKITIFVVMLDVFLAVLVFLPGEIDGKIATAIHNLKIGAGKVDEISKSIFARKEIDGFEKESGLKLTGDLEDVKSVVDEEKNMAAREGAVLGESDSVSAAAGSQSESNPSTSAAYYITKKITAGEILSALNHDLTYEQIAEHKVRRWNLNSNAVNSKKIVDYSIQSRDLKDNIRIRGNFTVKKTAYFLGDVEITGDISAATGTIVTLSLTSLDLGTNTITDGNFTGNWDFNGGGLSGLGDLLPDENDTYKLGSDSLRWKDIYLGGETLHIGTSTSDEYAVEYNTSLNHLGFNVNGSGNPEIIFDSSGNVGIGTTAPLTKLEVYGNISLTNELIFYPGENGERTGYINYSGYQGGLTQYRDLFIGNGRGSNVMYVDGSAGSVGIGTTNPGYTLTVGQNTEGNNTDYSIAVLRHGTTGTPGTYTNNAPALLINDISGDGLSSVDSDGGLLSIMASRIADADTYAANATLFRISNDDAGNEIRVDGKKNLWVGWDRNSISNQIGSLLVQSGNVGIGTTSPTYRLDITDSTTTRGLNIANFTALSYGAYIAGVKYGVYGTDGTTSGYLGYDDTYGLYTANNAYVGGTLTAGPYLRGISQ